MYDKLKPKGDEPERINLVLHGDALPQVGGAPQTFSMLLGRGTFFQETFKGVVSPCLPFGETWGDALGRDTQKCGIFSKYGGSLGTHPQRGGCPPKKFLFGLQTLK